MEKRLNWGLKLSLEEMALRRVAANVWKGFDILSSIAKCQIKWLSKVSIDIWRETVENKVKDKTLKLVLPESLKKQVIQLIRPMGSEILKWKIFHERILCRTGEYFDSHILGQLCWTCAGSIDYRNTAEVLVRLKIVNTPNSYKLACLYCLVDYIADLWEQLPKSTKGTFYNGEFSPELQYIDMRYYWAFILNDEDSKLDHAFGSESSFCKVAFRRLAFKGNKAATEYFLQKLPYEDRESCIVGAVENILSDRYIETKYCISDFPIYDVLSYLLSQMSPEKQLEVFKKHPCDVLKRFLDWPWQDLFLEIADVIWTFLPESSYDFVQYLVTSNFTNSGYYFPNFVQEFFLRSPNNFRKQFVSYWSPPLFAEFFNAEDTDTIKVVFRNADVENKARIVSGCSFFKLLDDLIMTGKWHLVELCLREATVSKEEMNELKQAFMGLLTGLDLRSMRLRKRKWRIFFQFLDETDKRSLNKRSYEGEMLTKAKKIRSEEEKKILPRI